MEQQTLKEAASFPWDAVATVFAAAITVAGGLWVRARYGPREPRAPARWGKQ